MLLSLFSQLSKSYYLMRQWSTKQSIAFQNIELTRLSKRLLKELKSQRVFKELKVINCQKFLRLNCRKRRAAESLISHTREGQLVDSIRSMWLKLFLPSRKCLMATWEIHQFSRPNGKTLLKYWEKMVLRNQSLL